MRQLLAYLAMARRWKGNILMQEKCVDKVIDHLSVGMIIRSTVLIAVSINFSVDQSAVASIVDEASHVNTMSRPTPMKNRVLSRQ